MAETTGPETPDGQYALQLIPKTKFIPIPGRAIRSDRKPTKSFKRVIKKTEEYTQQIQNYKQFKERHASLRDADAGCITLADAKRLDKELLRQAWEPSFANEWLLNVMVQKLNYEEEVLTGCLLPNFTVGDFATLLSPEKSVTYKIIIEFMVNICRLATKQSKKPFRPRFLNPIYSKEILEHRHKQAGRHGLSTMAFPNRRVELHKDFDILIIPLKYQNRWSVVVVDARRKVMTHLDSLACRQRSLLLLDTTATWLAQHVQEGGEYIIGWIKRTIPCIQESTIEDSGIWAILNTLYYAIGIEPRRLEEEGKGNALKMIRYYLASVILNGGWVSECGGWLGASLYQVELLPDMDGWVDLLDNLRKDPKDGQEK